MYRFQVNCSAPDRLRGLQILIAIAVLMAKRNKLRHLIGFVGILVFVLAWTALLWVYSPQEIVDWLGMTNSYLVAFFLAVGGAVASMTPFSTYPAVYTMASGGVNAFALVPLVAIGMTVGDFIFISFGRSARGLVSEKILGKLERLLQWLESKPTFFVQAFVFLWVGFLPIANNLLTAPLAMTGFSIRKLTPPLVLGNMMLPALLAAGGYYGMELQMLSG